MSEMAKFANQSKSTSVKKKVVIIDDAGAIGIEAANSLLQILEEAPDATVFILVANNSSSLLATVLSRLQSIHFYEPNNQQIAEFIQENKISPEYLELIGNRPAKLLNPDSTLIILILLIRFYILLVLVLNKNCVAALRPDWKETALPTLQPIQLACQ